MGPFEFLLTPMESTAALWLQEGLITCILPVIATL